VKSFVREHINHQECSEKKERKEKNKLSQYLDGSLCVSVSLDVIDGAEPGCSDTMVSVGLEDASSSTTLSCDEKIINYCWIVE